ncbi:YceI family protein [Domibacillus sp. DTU_2020_1001157_1_SI_ALB_TIR_016]|uniref:YceI family protein n=1 Tax=Domibacillus sp. DTU_2020_1001157_1_SI_ALB_TIR_016 TaxID=3077789 RepID=UPI0028E898A1|nr:YceI family protein [Domibacillus sp. DTU_2020_1001157_1_SI_ALB_TIR_016]WNS80429.1 YceI family protein [Domibacillus sp. DTU_2020_1001157_1_SI_ALB_TIR_016]
MAVLTFDQVHSGIAFQVKHMMVSKTKGEFTSFNVQFDGDINQLEAAKWAVSIDTASIDTNNEDRDNHLRSGDFFNAEQHPKITFISDTIQKVSENEYEVTGQLTLKGITNTETFTVEYNGTSKSPLDGSTIAGFDAEGKINREAYGLTWNAPLETGGVLVGKDVKFSANFEFVVGE